MERELIVQVSWLRLSVYVHVYVCICIDAVML